MVANASGNAPISIGVVRVLRHLGSSSRCFLKHHKYVCPLPNLYYLSGLVSIFLTNFSLVFNVCNYVDEICIDPNLV